MYFTVGRTANGQLWVRQMGNNHEILNHSEGYASWAGAKNVIEVVKAQAASATVWDVTTNPPTQLNV